MIDSLVVLLGLDAHDPAFWMPLLFWVLLFVILVLDGVLNGFDIGVGFLSFFAAPTQRLRMLSLLGPCRDANAYWLLLGVGLFFSVFPGAWGAILRQLYLPLCLVTLGVLLRNVAFELRVRAPGIVQEYWAKAFAAGSLCTGLGQGFLLGQIVGNYQTDAGSVAFSVLMACCVVAAHALLGAGWLIMREGGALRIRAALWGRRALLWTAAGVTGLSLVLASSSTGVLLKWGESSGLARVGMIWLFLLVCFVLLDTSLQRLVTASYRFAPLPFLLTALIYLVMFGGLAYSFFPYMVLDEATLWDAAVSVESMRLILILCAVVVPVAVIFNMWVYWRQFRAPQPASRGSYIASFTE